MTMLSVAAAYGSLVVVFQWGWLEKLGFAPITWSTGSAAGRRATARCLASASWWIRWAQSWRRLSACCSPPRWCSPGILRRGARAFSRADAAVHGGHGRICLTHDLFNLFVWFEVMSVAAFAVTGYALRSSALDGALNFTVVNTIGSYLILGGIGLIYSRVGALDFAALEQGVIAAPGDAVITTSFALLTIGLLTKAAQVPFHFWLSDAHTVAPSPVSVIFSGAMVAIGLFGVAKLTWTIFAPSVVVQQVVHTLLLGIGVAKRDGRRRDGADPAAREAAAGVFNDLAHRDHADRAVAAKPRRVVRHAGLYGRTWAGEGCAVHGGRYPAGDTAGASTS